MAETLEKLALCNANLSTEYVKLQKKYETLLVKYDEQRKEVADLSSKVFKRVNDLDELNNKYRALSEEFDALKVRVARHDPQFFAPMRSSLSKGPKRATTQPAPSSPQGSSPVDKI
jgi:chromosome segregation ATPase